MSVISTIKSFLGISQGISVTALMMIRNEEIHLEKCIEYLTGSGLSVVIIDNESTDNSVSIIRSFIERGYPVSLYSHPFTGVFDLEQMLIKIEEVARQIKSDWFVLTAPDEIFEAPAPFKSLYDGIARVDKEGYNTINFDEFVFVPTNPAESFVGKDYEKEMKYYYFFEPRPNRLLRAWKNSGEPINLSKNAGHRIIFTDQKVYPENFILKHYIFLSYHQGVKKYSSRVFAKRSINKGWHSNRYYLTDTFIELPSRDMMQFLSKEREYVKSDPQKNHLFIKTSGRVDLSEKYHINLKEIELIPYPDQQKWDHTAPVVFLVSYSTASVQPLIPFFKNINGSRLISGSVLLGDFLVDDLKNWPVPEKLPELSHELQNIYHSIYDPSKGAGPIIDISMENGFLIPAIQKYIPHAKFISIVQDIKTIIRIKNIQQKEKIIAEVTAWIAYLKSVRQNAQYCKEFFELRIEDVISDPVRVLEKISSFVGTDVNRSDGSLIPPIVDVLGIAGNDEMPEEVIDDIAGYWRNEFGYKS